MNGFSFFPITPVLKIQGQPQWAIYLPRMVSWFLLQRGSCKKSGFIKAACNSAMSFWMNMFSHWLAQWFWASFLISLSLNVLIWLWAVDVYSIRRSESSELSKYHLLPFLSPFPLIPSVFLSHTACARTHTHTHTHTHTQSTDCDICYFLPSARESPRFLGFPTLELVPDSSWFSDIQL